MPRSYALGSRFEELIDALVESGRYHCASEVVRDAMHLLEDRERLRAFKIEEIRRSIEEGRRGGRTFSAEKVLDRLEAKYSAMAEAAEQREQRDQPAA